MKRVKEKFNLKLDNITLDSLLLFLTLSQNDSSEEFLKEVGVKKLMEKKALEVFSDSILTTNLPTNVATEHPALKLLIKMMIEKKAVNKFWTIFSANMKHNKGILGWTILKQVIFDP